MHQGKLAILLHLLARPDERTFAVDVFDLEQFNVDGSGAGDMRRFGEHVERWGDRDRVDIIRASSTDLDPDSLTTRSGPARLVSIDGGHTAGITRNDLALVEGALVDEGCVILDDVFNPQWPGVVSGLVEYLRSNPVLVPVGLAPNKLFLIRPAARASYRTALRDGAAGTHLRIKDDSLFGCDIVSLLPDETPRWRRRVSESTAYRRLRDHHVGGRVVRAVRSRLT